MNLDAQFAEYLLKIIDQKINSKIPKQISRMFSATVVSVTGSNITVHLPNDPVSTNIVVKNSRNLTLTAGDQVYINAINGDLTNAFVDLKK